MDVAASLVQVHMSRGRTLALGFDVLCWHFILYQPGG